MLDFMLIPFVPLPNRFIIRNLPVNRVFLFSSGFYILCRKYGMSDATYYNWKAKYAGLRVSELKRLKVLEEEKQRLKQIVGEQALDIRALIEDWRRDYNEVRPHSLLKGSTPKEYAEIETGL